MKKYLIIAITIIVSLCFIFGCAKDSYTKEEFYEMKAEVAENCYDSGYFKLIKNSCERAFEEGENQNLEVWDSFFKITGELEDPVTKFYILSDDEDIYELEFESDYSPYQLLYKDSFIDIWDYIENDSFRYDKEKNIIIMEKLER